MRIYIRKTIQSGKKKTSACDAIKLQKPREITIPILNVPRFPLKQLRYMLKMTDGSNILTIDVLMGILTESQSETSRKKLHLTNLQRAKILSKRVEQIDNAQDLFTEPPAEIHSSKDMAYYEFQKGVLPTIFLSHL